MWSNEPAGSFPARLLPFASSSARSASPDAQVRQEYLNKFAFACASGLSLVADPTQLRNAFEYCPTGHPPRRAPLPFVLGAAEFLSIWSIRL